MINYPECTSEVHGLKQNKDYFDALSEFEMGKLLRDDLGYEIDIHDSTEVIEYALDEGYIYYNENDEFFFIHLDIVKRLGNELSNLVVD